MTDWQRQDSCTGAVTTARRRGERGLTLIELMVVSVIGLMMTGLFFQFFITQTRNFSEARMMAEMQQELRWAANYMGDRLKLAGNGVPQSSFVRTVENFDGGTGNPDSIVVIGSYKSVVMTTTQNMANEGSQVKVDTADGVEDGDLIVISYPPSGWQELFLATKVASDLHIYHDQSLPWNDDNKLDHRYPAGSICSAVTCYSFFIDEDDEGHSNLMVQTQAYQPQILAGDVEDLQIRFKLKDESWVDNPLEVSDIRMMELSIRARTPDPIKGHVDPEYGDEYKRLTHKANIIPKNIIFVAE